MVGEVVGLAVEGGDLQRRHFRLAGNVGRGWRFEAGGIGRRLLRWRRGIGRRRPGFVGRGLAGGEQDGEQGGGEAERERVSMVHGNSPGKSSSLEKTRLSRSSSGLRNSSSVLMASWTRASSLHGR